MATRGASAAHELFMRTSYLCVVVLTVSLVFAAAAHRTAPAQDTVKAAHGESVPRVEQKTAWEEKARDLLEPIVSVLALAWAMWRFGINRGRFTFLDLELSASVLYENENLLLVSVTIRLQNRGQTKIQARTRKHLAGDTTFMHSEEADRCKHAGTLKMRRVQEQAKPVVFDWYSLPEVSGFTVLKDGNVAESSLEQVNYLNEYEDPNPEVPYNDVDFWLEPKETDNCRVMIWLPPGVYAMKAYFFGKRNDYKEDEYWSCTRVFNLQPRRESARQPGAPPVVS